MKFVYLDKEDRIKVWLQSRRQLWAFAAGAIFLLLPLWRGSISGRFVLEAANRAVIRTQVPGRVIKVYVDEGQTVWQQEPVAQLRNLPLASRQDNTEAAFRAANAELSAAESHYTNMGLALAQRNQLVQQTLSVNSEAAQLVLKSPISGIVTTPRVADEEGNFVKEGTELAEISDISTMRARIYVSEYDMYKYRPGSPGLLHVDGILGKWVSGKVQVSPASTEIAPGLIDLSKFKGTRPPAFYEMDLWVTNSDGKLKPGMVGTARLYGQRRSLAGLAYCEIGDFVGRRVW